MEEKRMTVIYTTINDLSSFGGVETMIIQEARYLRSKGFEIHVLSPVPKSKIRLETAPGVTARHPPSRLRRLRWPVRYAIFLVWFAREVYRLGRKDRVVAVPFTVYDGAGVALAKLCGAKVRMVQRVVGPLAFEFANYSAPELRHRYRVYSLLMRLLEVFSYKIADSILPVSEFEEANIMSYHIDRRKVRLVRCGVDGSLFTGTRVSKPLTLPQGSKVVMFVGRMVEKNGPLVIAEAVPMILKSNPDSVVVFIGDGELKKTIETMLSEEIASGRVLMTGSRSDIPQLHGQADVYVGHVSSKVEGLGQTVFEAMMSGIPTVSGRDYISEKIVEDGVSGILVPKDNPAKIAEAVGALLRDKDARERIGRAGRKAAEEKISFESSMTALIEEIVRTS